MLALPTLFIEQLRPLLPNGELEDFMGALNTPPPVSIRFNPKKKLELVVFEQNLGLHTEPVAWHTEGVYLDERPIFTLDPSFHAGAYYVQEASSMFIAEALKQHVDFQENIKILDLCAAPGGKSTLLAALMSDDSFLLANEVIKSRVDILKENIIKWGQPNVYVSNHDPEDFAALNGFFDVVLVDAPCSGEGMFRKDPQAAQEWSPEAVLTCSARQKRILTHAQNLVKSGGFLLYSTCTYNEFENEKNADFILENADFQPLTIKLVSDWKISKLNYGYQFFPHKTKGEGFYLSLFQKKGKKILTE
ncbi:MAG: RsmB/NOP family class I SAM-dependent RNA methyltransferase [Saprospiraceae bacterium]|nr:RsmB/NOP family class I SAM-dependent RNA methyltransferase [Saprospiraceae bacterium]